MNNELVSKLVTNNILIVDDEPVSVRFLSKILKDQGYIVRIALNGQVALNTIKIKLPDLILLDINMPDINGFEVCQRLKASELYKNIPVIFLSASNKIDDKVKGLQVGGIDYIIKPFFPEEVLARVQTHLSIKIMQQCLATQNIQLQQAHEQLEKRVQERTNKLELTNIALLESEQRYADLYDNAPDMYVSVDAKTTKVKQCNQTLAKKLGYSKQWIIGKPIFELYHLDCMKKVEAAFQTFVETGEIYNAELQLKCKDGSKIDVNLNVTSVRDEQGEILYSRSCWIDITERKQAEKNIREQARLLDLIFENSLDSLVLLDKDYNFIRVSKTYAKTDNRDVSEFSGFNHFEFYPSDFKDEADQAKKEKKIYQRFARPFTFPEHPEWGTTYWDLALVPILDKQGEIELFLFTLKNVTALKEAEIALKKAKKEADLANQAKSEFLANMSHEIRTPMNSVIGFSDILAEQLTDKEQKSYLNSIRTAGRTLLTLINDILDLSKIEAGQLEIQYKAINPRFIFNELQQIFSLKIAEKNLEFIMEVDDNLPAILLLDETRLRQILLNLIGNAIKFTEHGYIKLCVHQNSHGNKIDLIIVVKDSGIGIPIDQQTVIFEYFKQQDGQSTRQYEGTGLGLAITKRLVEIMNGQISVNSTPNKGSHFEIILREIEIATDVLEIPPKNYFNLDNIVFKKVCVLVVDNLESNRNLIIEYLSTVNLEIIGADNGEKALFFTEEYRPALILMDLRMPIMDGFEATKRLKNNPNTANIPVIALTASVTSEIKISTEKYHFDGFLAKPIDIYKLLTILSLHLKYTQKTTDSIKVDNTLHLENIVDLAILQQEIEQEIIPLWQQANIIIKMDIIIELAEKMILLGNKHNISYFIHYGELLQESTQIFDIPYIQQALKELPNLIKPLNISIENRAIIST